MFVKNKIHLKIVCFLLAFLCIFCSISYASDSVYVWSSESEPLNNTTSTTSANIVSNDSANEVSSNSNPNNTVTTSANITDLNLQCGGAILIEMNSGNVLYDHNMHEQLRPASVTKVMTLLLIMEAIDSGRLSYTDKIPCSENASNTNLVRCKRRINCR